MSDKIKNYLYLFFGFIVVAGAITKIAQYPYAFYIFSAGMIGLIILKVMNLTSSPSDNFRIRRLHRIQFIGVLLLVGSAYLMYIANNAWALALILFAVFDLVVAFRTPTDKEKKAD